MAEAAPHPNTADNPTTLAKPVHTPPSGDPEAPGQVVAGHVLQRLLGSGTHGRVYLACRVGHTRPVALKLMNLPLGGAAAAAAQQFLAVAETARRLQHPDVVRVLDAGVERHRAWLAMEPVPGGELGRYARTPRLLPEPLVLSVCQRLAQALAYAHRQGVVHRDLKPANVLVHWPSQTVKLTDFGLARVAEGANTVTGLLLGTPAYMAPEQLAGNIPTPQCDLYALGVTLYELLVGEAAFPGPSMGDLLRQVAEGSAPDLGKARPDLPPALAALSARLLARAPADRPASGDEVAQALAAVQAQWPAAPGQPPPARA